MAIAQQTTNDLWEEFKKFPTIELKHKLMLEYAWVVKYVILKSNLPNNTVLEEGDFVSFGMLGLNDAIERYDLDKGVKFETYAMARVRGAIQDELRKLDFISRSTREKARKFMKTKDELSMEHGREVTLEEIMCKMQVTPAQYKKYLKAAESARSFLSLNDSNSYINEDNQTINLLEEVPENTYDNFLNIIMEQEQIEYLIHYLQELEDKQRMVIVLYYYEDMTFKEIGTQLGISESRVCQIHSQCIGELRKKLNKVEK